jgi:predicted phosphodiesterase
MPQQSAKGSLWQKHHPEACARRMREYREKYGRNDGIYAQMIAEQRQPILIKSNNIIVSSDYHIPFHDIDLFWEMIDLAKEEQIPDLAIVGDFWDCDNYTKFIRTVHTGTFQEEIDEVRACLKPLIRTFKKIYICRGNHEKRWLDLNAGHMTMEDLFGLTGLHKGYQVTRDDHMYLFQGQDTWLLCHPKNFRIVNLSVARDLAAKFHCHVIVAHGHQFAQGWDKSGAFRICDGGGLFDKNSLDYHWETTCHPEVRSGFYVIREGQLYPFEGK